jgi:hypothetical protein
LTKRVGKLEFVIFGGFKSIVGLAEQTSLEVTTISAVLEAVQVKDVRDS